MISPKVESFCAYVLISGIRSSLQIIVKTILVISDTSDVRFDENHPRMINLLALYLKIKNKKTARIA